MRLVQEEVQKTTTATGECMKQKAFSSGHDVRERFLQVLSLTVLGCWVVALQFVPHVVLPFNTRSMDPSSLWFTVWCTYVHS